VDDIEPAFLGAAVSVGVAGQAPHHNRYASRLRARRKGGNEGMSAATPHNKGGRPKTGHRNIPAVRLPKDLFFRLERRMALIAAKTGYQNMSKFVRESIKEKLDALDAVDRRDAHAKTPRKK